MSYVPLLLHFCYKLVTTCLYGEPARVEQSEIISACWAIPPSHINTTKILREQGMSWAGLIKRVSLARQADSPHLINRPLEGTCKNSFTQYTRVSLRAWPNWGTGISPSSHQHCLVSNQDKDKDKDKCFIINRAPTDTCVYNDNKDFRAIITEVYICKIYTTIKQGYI